MGRVKERCPRCGYELSPKHGKTIVRILVDKECQDIWEDFAIKFPRKALAFRELLILAGLLKEGKPRAYVEIPSKG